MTHDEALKEAQKIGGTLDWSRARGFFVTGGYPGARPVPWYKEIPLSFGMGNWAYVPLAPGESQGRLPVSFVPLPAGFTTPPAGYKLVQLKPKISYAAQQELTRLGIALPKGLTPIPGTYEERLTEEEEVVYLNYVAACNQALVKPLSKEEWIAGGKPPSPTQTQLKGDEFVRLEPYDGYLVPVYRDAQGNEYRSWSEAVPQRGAAEREPSPWEQGQDLWEREWAEQRQQFQGQQQEQLIGWYREEQAAKLAAEKQQRLAQLAAQPMSWLQYAAESGIPPVIQPWMLPLMPEQYSQFGAGMPIPGDQGIGQGTGQGIGQGTGATAGATNFSWLPPLTQPATQYQARMGPTAQQQYYGYQQARESATPEETRFRLWSQAPPSGHFAGLRYSPYRQG